MKELTKYLMPLLMLLPYEVWAATPNFDIATIVHWAVVLIIVAVIFGILLFLVRRAPFIDPPIKQGIEYVLWFLLALAVIAVLLGYLR